MKTSGYLALNWRDFLKGLLVAVLTAVFSSAVAILQAGGDLTFKSFVPALLAGLAALLSYLLKNFFTNTEGEILTKEG